MPRRWLAALLLALSATPLPAAEPPADLIKPIQSVAREGAGSPAARAAWDRLVALGPAALPTILDAMGTPNTVVANWLQTAFDRIVERERQAGGKGIDVDALLKFAGDPKRQGRVRRLALELADQLRAGTSERLIPGWLDDPEFRFEAVAMALKQAEALAQSGKTDVATAAYRKAFSAARDVPQVRAAAAGLATLGVKVSVDEHLGVLTDWYLIGPLDAHGMKGFTTVYPPEQKVDLSAQLPGKKGPVRWKHYRLPESPPTATGHPGHIQLHARDVLGNADDAVAFAYTEISVPEARVAEFRGAADDNFTVYVNGKREFGLEEYRNGVRFDRHRFKVKLKPGVNTVLVKVCQAPVETTNPADNWEFFLRVVDDTGKGVGFKSALADRK